MSPLQSLYDHPFYKKPHMPPGHNLQPLPRGLWGIVLLKYIISGLSNYVEQSGYLKIWFDVFGGMVGVGGGLVALQSLSTV